MRSIETRAVLALSCIAVAAFSTPAFSKPSHHRHAARALSQVAQPATYSSQADSNTIAYPQALQAPLAETQTRSRRRRVARSRTSASFASAGSAFGSGLSLGGGGLVGEARRYLGTNPTGRASLWCGNFMNLVLERSGYQTSGSNLARSFASYGHRVGGPQVGAIAVMSRRGGGHVGVVTGIDASGNPILISGNHNRTVAESVYPRGRIYAYVVPN